MKRKHFFVLAMLFVLSLTLMASASGAPTSQFGFSGWPYRQSNSCGTTDNANSCNTNDAGACKTPSNCTPCPVITPCPTVVPTQEPTVVPEPTATMAPTVSPTQAPTVAPTAKPTAKPTATPTLKPTAAPTAKPTSPSDDDYTTDSITVQEQTALKLMNQDRANNGLSALTVDPALCALARLKSCDMNANNYFAHTSPTLGSAAEMLKAHGYRYSGVGENIAHHATVEKSQAAFMSSDGHRRNILGSQWTKVGIGVCYDKNGYVYVTQLFVR